MRKGQYTKMLGDICTINPPKKEAKEALDGTGMVSFVPMSNLGIYTKALCLDTVKSLADAYKSYTYFAENDVLLAKITPCFENGKIGIARNLLNAIGFGSSEYIVLRPASDTLSDYIYYFLSQASIRTSGAKFMTGAVGHKRIPEEYIHHLQIFLPPLPEQRRIVAILDDAFARIDKAIANTEKNIANAKELFESVRYSLMEKGGDKSKQLYIEDVALDFKYGTSEKSSQSGSVAVLRMGNIQNGKIDWSNLVYTANDDDIKKLRLNYDDVLFNRTNSDVHVGKTAIYKGEYPAIFAGYLIRILTNKNLVVPDYLNYYLNGFEAREYGKSVMSRSVNQANINCSKLKRYPILVPSLQVQRSIVKILSELEEYMYTQTSLMENKLTSLRTLKQSLLAAAFSGELTADFNPEALEDDL